MKSMFFATVTAMALWSGGASADIFQSCSDAANYGYDTTRGLVSASYNRASCDRARATQYEQFLTAIVPRYLSGIETTESKTACLFQGSYEGWMDAMSDEYQDCKSSVGFDAIPYATLGMTAASLLEALFQGTPSYTTPNVVDDVFTYDYGALALTGLRAQCEAAARSTLSGVSQELVTALVLTVCQ